MTEHQLPAMLTVHQPWWMTHRRLGAAAYFARFGFIAGFCIIVAVTFFTTFWSHPQWITLAAMMAAGFGYGFYGGFCAFLSGFCLGMPILYDKEIQTEAQASEMGGYVAAAAHFTGPLLVTCLITPIMLFTVGPSALMYPLGALAFGLFSLILAGIITVPIGRLAGRRLFRRRKRLNGPIGCTIHGYRLEEVKHNNDATTNGATS